MAKAKYTITAPIKKTGDGYSLHFVDGVAVTDRRELAEYLATLGYEVTKSGKDTEADKSAEGDKAKS